MNYLVIGFVLAIAIAVFFYGIGYIVGYEQGNADGNRAEIKRGNAEKHKIRRGG